MAVAPPTENVQEVQTVNYSVKLRIPSSPRDKSPLEASNVRAGSMEGGKDVGYLLWTEWETFEQAWAKGWFKVERFDPSNRVLEGTIDRIKRKGL